MSPRTLHSIHLCYLTPPAALAVATMIDAGIDQDLAVALLEQIWPEAEVYAITEDEERRA